MPFVTNAKTIVAEGKIYQAHGNGRHAPVAAQDIARVVVALLGNPEPHSGETYVVTGPEALSQHDIAAVFAKALGKPVEYVELPVEEWQQAAAAAGLPAFVVKHLGHAADDHRAGRFDQVTDTVREITGKPAQSFEDFVRANLAALAA